MKKNLLFVSFLCLSSFPSALAQAPGDSVFAGVQIHSINFRFSQLRYWDSLTTYYAQNNEQNIAATVIVNGVRYDSVGVRFKGNSSYSHPNNKKSFRVSFDHYRNNQRWNGLKGIHLNNCWGDPTFMREKIHLDFCRDAGINAPRANFARLSINDTLFAFYTLVEHVDKVFLDSRYGTTTGDLFKAVDGFGGGNPQVSTFQWLGADTSLYLTRYELKTEESTSGWRKLVSVIDTLNNSANPAVALPLKVNTTTLSRAIAADNLFGNLDAYINSARNFYFYFHPTTEKLEWIPWDLGLSFGSYTGGVSSIETMSITYVSNATTRPMVGKLVNTTALRNEYLRALCLLSNGYFSSARLFPKIDSIANAIRPYVTEDPRKMYTVTQFETNINVDINAAGGGGTRKPGLKSFITARHASVQSQLASLGINCALAVNPGDVVINEFMADNDSLIPDPSGEFEDWIELCNNTNRTIDLSGMYLTDDFARPTKWQFPATTTIAAGGYLIVWADEDSGQAGLHANFRLSATGERLRLGNVDASVLDTISFGDQPENRTTARVPNGTGNFIPNRLPTFNASNGTLSVGGSDVPVGFALEQNYPNPFNPKTNIGFSVGSRSDKVQSSGRVILKVFGILGNEVATLVNEVKPAGTYVVVFDASSLASGVYYYRLTSGALSETKKMIVVR
jgi:spore coat protein CotH